MKVYPKTLYFMVAEVIRTETAGKLSVLGYFAGDDLTIHGPDPQGLPENTVPSLSSLAFLIVIKDGYGEFDSKIRILSPDGKDIGEGPAQKVVKTDGAAFNYIVPIAPFPIRQFGEHQFHIKLDKKTYRFPFMIRHAPVPIPTDARAKTGRKPRAKAAAARLKR